MATQCLTRRDLEVLLLSSRANPLGVRSLWLKTVRRNRRYRFEDYRLRYRLLTVEVESVEMPRDVY